MLIDAVIEDARWQAAGLEAEAETAARAALTHLGLDPEAHEIALLACDDARIAELNASFRGKPTPTNVLSWPAEELAAEADGGVPDLPGLGELGDIAIAWETCLREAQDGGKPLVQHLRHLTVHAVLHLLGYDHETDADAARMEGLEVEILGKLGDPSPY
jgi:probable rRNA maturation factor